MSDELRRDLLRARLLAVAAFALGFGLAWLVR